MNSGDLSRHNPLQLLHTALSVGLHELTDNDCHERAGTIRAVLIGFAKRVANALHDDAELRAAVSKLRAIETKLEYESNESNDAGVQNCKVWFGSDSSRGEATS